MKYFRENFRFRNILVVFLVALLFVCNNPRALAGAPSFEPKTNKTIRPNGDKTYEIKLSTRGHVTEEVENDKVDLHIMLDVSGSMNWTMEGEDICGARQDDCQYSPEWWANARINILKKMLVDGIEYGGMLQKGIIDEVFDIGANVKVSLSTFATRSNFLTWDSYPDRLKGVVNNIVAEGYTNTKSAFTKLNEVTRNNSRPDAKKIIILLTDGRPTAYFDDYGDFHYHSETNAKREAKKAAQKLKDVDYFYIVGLLSDRTYWSAENTEELERYLKGIINDRQVLPKAIEKKYIPAPSTEGLYKAFIEAISKIKRSFFHHITIEDTLSENVELAFNPNNISKELKVVYVDNKKPNVEEEVSSSKIKSVTYDSNTRKIKIVFQKDFALENDREYFIKFNVKPSTRAYEKAYDHYLNNSDDLKLKSNGDASITSKYGDNDTDIVTKYKSPEFTIPSFKLKIVKNWSGDTVASRPKNISFDIVCGDDEKTINVSLNENDKNPTNANEWTKEIELPREYSKYKLVNEQGNGIDKYNPVIGTINMDNSSKVNGFFTKATVVVENKILPKLVIKKTVEGGLGNKQLPFEFRLEVEDKTLNKIFGGIKFINGVAEFKLKHGQQLSSSELPLNTKITLSELNADGYDIVYKMNNNIVNRINKTLVTGDTVIEVINSKNGTPDTGIINNNAALPLLLLCASVVIIFGIVKVRKTIVN